MLLQSWQHFTSSPPPQAKVIITMKSRIRHGLDFVASQSPKSMTLAFSCHESEGRALDLRLRLKTTLFVPPSSVKGNVNLPFALHIRRQHTHRGTHRHRHTQAQAHMHMLLSTYIGRDRRQKTVGCRLACLPALAVAQKCMLHFMPLLQLVCLHLSLSLYLFLCLPSLFRVLGFFMAAASTLKCVNSSTFYGILMLNMTAILFLFYLPTRACLCVCVCVSFFDCLIAYWPPRSAPTLSYFSLMLPALPLPQH